MDNKIVLTDTEFILLKRRDRTVFENVYNAAKDRILTFLLAKAFGNRELAEEIFAEASLAFYESLPKLKNKENIASWWFCIAGNKFNDYLRKHYRRKSRFTPFTEEEEDKQYDKSLLPDEEALHNERKRYVALAMEGIKPKYKEVLTLKYYEEKSQKEIASLLQQNERAVEALLFRARKSLSDEINKLYKL